MLAVIMMTAIASASVSPGKSQAEDDMHLVDLWLRGKSVHSQEAYRRDVNQFVDFVDKPFTSVDLKHLWNWVDALSVKGLAPATIARKLAAVKSLFTFAHRIGYLPFNVGAALPIPAVADHLSDRILLVDSVRRLIAAEPVLRNSVLLQLFYASGARVSELVNLIWGALVPRSSPDGLLIGQVTLLGKGNKTRSILLPAGTWESIQKLRTLEEAAGYAARVHPVFRSRKGGQLSRQQIWRIVRGAAKRVGIEKSVSPHWLRHAHASHALDNGAPMHLVKETLGHKSLVTTSKYAHARPDDSSALYLKI